MAVALLAAALLSCWGCKKSDEVPVTATYIVIVSAGVNGTPAAGELTLTVGSELNYSYSLQSGYTQLTVQLDDAGIAASGKLTVAAGTHYLQAYADSNVQYSLKVTLANGVNGTPAAGTHYYPQGTVVDYGYSIGEGYTALEVTVDGAEAATSGSIVMDGNHTIAASAGALYNIRGTWTLKEAYADGSAFEVTATFSGSLDSGTVTDSDGGSGTYAVSANNADFTLLFPGVTYEYDGKFSGVDTISGSCKRYQTADAVISGSFEATRTTAAVAPRTPAATSKKGKGAGR
jgi:uncharacterized Zn-binding protein involved in type VI secretion